MNHYLIIEKETQLTTDFPCKQLAFILIDFCFVSFQMADLEEKNKEAEKRAEKAEQEVG